MVEPPSTPEPEPPNPFNELTDQALEEYRIEVQRKQLAVDGKTSRVRVSDVINHLSYSTLQHVTLL